MNWTSTVVAALLLGFVVSVISRNELSTYMGILGIGQNPNVCAPAAGQSIGNAPAAAPAGLSFIGGNGGPNVSIPGINDGSGEWGNLNGVSAPSTSGLGAPGNTFGSANSNHFLGN